MLFDLDDDDDEALDALIINDTERLPLYLLSMRDADLTDRDFSRLACHGFWTAEWLLTATGPKIKTFRLE